MKKVSQSLEEYWKGFNSICDNLATIKKLGLDLD